MERLCEDNMASVSKVPAIDRMISILDFVGVRRRASFNEIIENLNIPKSSGYYVLEALCDKRILRKRKDGTYVLGLHIFELGALAAKNLDIRSEAKPFLETLTRETQLVSHHAVLEGHQAFYITKIESPERNVLSVGCSWEGKALTYHNTALGKVLLAWQQPDFIEEVVDKIVFTPRTETTILDKESYLKELKKVKEQGWGFDNGEDLSEIRCIAVPVFGYRQEVASAIGITGLASKFENGQLAHYLEILKRTADDISKAISE